MQIKPHPLWLPAAWLYGCIMRVRNLLFDRGVIKAVKPKLPTISVGNIVAGGTGKTPHTDYLVQLLKKDYSVAVLSRGYGRKTKGYRRVTTTSTAEEVGDEPLQLYRKHPEVTVAVCEKRAEGCEQLSATTHPHVEVIVLDDAHQHRHVHPGLRMVLLNHALPPFKNRMLPAGTLREPAAQGLNRADIVVVSKCPSALTEAAQQMWQQRLHLRQEQQLFFSTMQYGRLYPAFAHAVTTHEVAHVLHHLEHTHALVLCAIAQPQPLMTEATKRFATCTTCTFPDHHAYTPADMALLRRQWKAIPQPAVVITTEKDAVKLTQDNLFPQEMRAHLWVQPIEVRFLPQGTETAAQRAKHFNNLIRHYVEKNRRSR